MLNVCSTKRFLARFLPVGVNKLVNGDADGAADALLDGGEESSIFADADES